MKACYCCGEYDEKVLILEGHHIFGRKYSPETISLCLNCHKRITDEQNKLPVVVRKNNSRKCKDIFALCSIGAFHKVWGEEEIKIALRVAEYFKGAKK